MLLVHHNSRRLQQMCGLSSDENSSMFGFKLTHQSLHLSNLSVI